MKISLNLDDIDVGNDWGESVGSILEEELKREIRAEIKRHIKGDPVLAELVKTYKETILHKLMEEK